MRETIEVPVSELRKSQWYARNRRWLEDKASTAAEMRDRGYVVNERTWPAAALGTG